MISECSVHMKTYLDLQNKLSDLHVRQLFIMQHIRIVSFQDYTRIIRNGAKPSLNYTVCWDILTEPLCLKHMAIPSVKIKAVVL